ncbi:MAG: aldo/keto reductase [Gammaproteobacteria bacterium]|nr:aldo/keto reductase [Gammaproteobacteria bacterium]
MIERIPFGNTGHLSSRIIFGAAALGGMKPERAMATLELITAAGINHIDTAASYGDSELRLAPWLRAHRSSVFLATKTGQRSYAGAREELRRSLDRLGVPGVDLIQMHNLVDKTQWEQAFSEDGALRALIEARDEGLVRFIGVTGHGTYVAERHLQSLERFPFASVLCPYAFVMNRGGPYADDFESLYRACQARGVAIQTIKSVAARRWRDEDEGRRLSWYLPLKDADAIRRAVHFVLSRPGLFLNSSSDATLLPAIIAAAEGAIEAPDPVALETDAVTLGVEPLFVRDVMDDVRV